MVGLGNIFRCFVMVNFIVLRVLYVDFSYIVKLNLVCVLEIEVLKVLG